MLYFLVFYTEVVLYKCKRHADCNILQWISLKYTQRSAHALFEDLPRVPLQTHALTHTHTPDEHTRDIYTRDTLRDIYLLKGSGRSLFVCLCECVCVCNSTQSAPEPIPPSYAIRHQAASPSVSIQSPRASSQSARTRR